MTTNSPEPTALSKKPKLWRYKSIIIRERVNTAGSVSYLVEMPGCFSVAGSRFFKQFPKRPEAEAYLDVMTAKRDNQGTAGFALSAGHQEQAAMALSILEPLGATLLQAAKFFASHTRPLAGDITSGELTEKFLSDKANKKKLRGRSVADLRSRLGQFNV